MTLYSKSEYAESDSEAVETLGCGSCGIMCAIDCGGICADNCTISCEGSCEGCSAGCDSGCEGTCYQACYGTVTNQNSPPPDSLLR